MTNSTSVPHESQLSPPSPPSYPFIGPLLKMRTDFLQFLIESTSQYGDIVHLGNIRSRQFYLINHPKYIKHVLQDNYRNYTKSKALSILLGESLVVSDGQTWLRQRRLMQPAFHHEQLEMLTTIMVQTIETFLGNWQKLADDNKTINIAKQMQSLTQHIITNTMFSTDVGNKTDQVSRAIAVINQYFSQRMVAFIKYPAWLPTLKNLRFNRSMKILDEIIYEIIDERRQRQKTTGDLLSMLLSARDEQTGKGLSDKQLRGEIMTIYLAGHESTANALAWTWYLIAKNPEIAQKLYRQSSEVLHGRLPTIKDLPHLSYMKMVFQEAMRLYPPVWIINRKSIKKDKIGGYTIPANAKIFISPYLMQRHPNFWENPDEFNPERFSPEKSHKQDRFAYIPFGGGPRVCIGNNFAMIEGQLIIAMIARNYHLQLASERFLKPKPLVVLKPSHDILMMLHKQTK